MAKLALLLLAPAAALVPSKTASSSTRLAGATLKDPKSSEFAYGLPGNKIPGNELSSFDFDPLGFAERASPADMVKYREAELKRGAAMLAITGMLFAEVWHPMLAATTNVPAIYGFQATLQQSPTDFKMKEGAVPGSYANVEGASPWTKDKLSPEEYERKEVVELNNGRLAMLARRPLGPGLISSSPYRLEARRRAARDHHPVNTGSFRPRAKIEPRPRLS
ncbi:chlorophyll A-B binding protein [Aureococcus anophagefferens]|nr:chlorophyll A-B binding protein [Aureococcus anophagefferens]